LKIGDAIISDYRVFIARILSCHTRNVGEIDKMYERTNDRSDYWSDKCTDEDRSKTII